MVEFGYTVIIVLFVVYYVLVYFSEKKAITDAKELIAKFFDVLLFYAGISIIYFAITGKPFYGDSIETYRLYIFIVGFIALVWTLPSLLKEFKFFRKRFKSK